MHIPIGREYGVTPDIIGMMSLLKRNVKSIIEHPNDERARDVGEWIARFHRDIIISIQRNIAQGQEENAEQLRPIAETAVAYLRKLKAASA
jgi:hypothetical protein